MQRFIFPTIVVVMFLAAFVIKFGSFIPQSSKNLSCAQRIVCKDCNIILVSADSLRADHVGVYGYNRNTTPNFDALSKKGILFTNYYTASYLTPISEMALHTGMYPTSNGVTNFNYILPKNIETLAQILKKNSFQTHSLHSSLEYFVYPAIKNSFDRGFDSYTQVAARTIPGIDNVMSNLKSNPKNNFWWITLGNMHWPLGQTAKNVYADPNYNGVLKGKSLDGTALMSIYNGFTYTYNSKTKLTNADTQYVKDMYDNGVSQFDDFLGNLVSNLKASGMMDKTIIVIASEHGEDLGEHGYFAHYDIYNDQVHTPLLIVAPGLTPEKINSTVGSVDVLPTILGLLGMAPPYQSQGKSVLPIICGDEKDNRDTTFIERTPLWEEADIVPILKKYYNITVGSNDKDYSIISGDYKYIRRDSQKELERISWWKVFTHDPSITFPAEELYDIKNDPNEKNNLIGKVPQTTVDILRQKLNDWLLFIKGKAPLNVQHNQQLQNYF